MFLKNSHRIMISIVRIVLRRKSDDGEQKIIRLIRLISNLISMLRNTNLSKFVLLNYLDLPIQNSDRGSFWYIRVFRTLPTFYKIKSKKYTFLLRKCTLLIRNFIEFEHFTCSNSDWLEFSQT